MEFSKPGASHALYDLLLNWTDPKLELRAKGPPRLVSTGPFLGACLSIATISRPIFVLGASFDESTTMVDVKGKNDTPNGRWNVTIQSATGSGGLLPTSLRNLVEYAAKKVGEDGDLKVVFDSQERVCGFLGGNVDNGTASVKAMLYKDNVFQIMHETSN